MAQLWKFSRKSKAAKNSAAQPHTHKSTSFPTTIQQGPTASTPGSGAVSPTNQETNPKESGKVLRDLWQEALDNLDDEKKSALKLRFDRNGQVQPCVTDAIQGVVTSIEASFEEYKNGGLKIKDRDGRVLCNVRENGKEILKFALRSKAIIDSGVKFDPTGYSSSAWAVISLGLQVVQNDQDRLSAIFDASALLAGILHRYANIEAHYRDQDLPDVMELEDRLRSSYEAILNFVAMVEKQRCQRFWGQVWYSLYSLSEQPLQQLKDSILSADNAAEQWRQLIEHEYRLKESETINKKVDETCGKLDRILDGLDQTLMAINRGNQLLEMILVQLESKGDVKQMSAFFHQRVAEGLDQPTIARVVDNNNESRQVHVEDHDPYLDSEENLDRLLREVFVELREFDQDSKQHRHKIEQLPEMRPHKTKNLNLLRADKIMGWIESDTSQLLWINGNSVIGRYDFNSMFVVPLLLFGESNFEQVLILRHFCGDNPSFKTNNYRTLVQALVFQILKQRPGDFRGQIPSITRNQTDDIMKLWTLFLECVREVRADCTFIIIDGIDYLQDANTPEGFSERELVLQHLDALVKDRMMLIKILLTSSLTSELPSSTEDQRALVLASRLPGAAPRRRLSLAIIQDELPLVPQKLIEIQERRCRSLSFSQLYMIYPENSIIYTFNDGQLQALIVDRLSGMEERSNGTYDALQIRAWSIDHNGRYFTKRYHEFLISQFPGKRPITRLKYIPSGYLNDEPGNRAKLIARGRRYWELGSGIHYQQVVENRESVRIVIDQNTRPLKPPSAQELEDEFQVVSQHSLKPRILMICPPTIASYVLGHGKWKTVNIDEVHDVIFQDDLFDQLILPKERKKTMSELVLSQTETQERTRSQLGNRARSGLTVLLHGGPGTGKTFTATGTAEKIRRPLLLGSIEVGGSIADLEQSLNQSFQLAERWGAILLLEDVDSFLAERPNSESSNFAATFTKAIHAIDKHSGVLFLTTCRVGVLDEAVLSRIDYTVHYEPLSDDACQKIWRMVLRDKVQGSLEDILEGILELSTVEGLNGWDIQTVVLAACQLASRQDKPLEMKTIKHVLRARSEFTSYLTQIQGRDLALKAKDNGFRYDSR